MIYGLPSASYIEPGMEEDSDMMVTHDEELEEEVEETNIMYFAQLKGVLSKVKCPCMCAW